MTEKKIKISASDFFHKRPENLNCAQAILKRFQKEFHLNAAEIEAFRACGGGRAEGGVCGALFAAEGLAQEHYKSSLKDEFEAIAGSCTCKEIKARKFPCVSCVNLAEELLEKRIK